MGTEDWGKQGAAVTPPGGGLTAAQDPNYSTVVSAAALETELKLETGQAAQASELTEMPALTLSSSSISMSNWSFAGVLLSAMVGSLRGVAPAPAGLVTIGANSLSGFFSGSFSAMRKLCTRRPSVRQYGMSETYRCKMPHLYP